MPHLLWDNMVLVCDICKERPLKKVVEVSRGRWVGVCSECEPNKEVKNDNDQK